MPKVVVPSRSGVHRFACLALYRALLRQCSLPIGSPRWLDETKLLVKQRFRRYRQLQSPSQVANAMKAGYNTLDLLDSATKGNDQDVYRIQRTLSQTKDVKARYADMQSQRAQMKPPKPPSPRQTRKAESIQFQEKTHRRNPDTPSILDRPRPVSGTRKVPALVSARGVPFLRLKERQPRNLSGVIRNKLETRWHRIEVRDRLQLEHLFAQDEDAWDRMTNATESCTWSEEIKRARDDVCTKILESDQKNKVLAENMWKVVLAERKAAKEEEEQRKVDI